jgi:hypothetical protein
MKDCCNVTCIHDRPERRYSRLESMNTTVVVCALRKSDVTCNITSKKWNIHDRVFGIILPLLFSINMPIFSTYDRAWPLGALLHVKRVTN